MHYIIHEYTIYFIILYDIERSQCKYTHCMVRVSKEELKKEMPNDLIVLRDRNGRKRILVPKSQRIALAQTEHKTLLHVKGNRISHEVSRSYFWPKMT